MSLFRQPFRSGSSGSSATPPPDLKPQADGEPIRVFDKFGRELLVPRQEWLKVMHDNMRKAWSQPDELGSQITMALQDGFYAEVEEAATQLHRIDADSSRGAVLLAIVYLQTNRPAEAKTVLENYLATHGADSVVLINLAKALDALGRHEESLATLWHALELDPNQENGLGWYEVIHREKDGEQGSLHALRRIAELPGSWRARLWLARHDLEQARLDEALARYRQAIALAPRPVPTDILMQLSGDLGNHGHLLPLLELTSPHFDPKVHGLLVGNNLIKASIDTGQLDGARALLDHFQSQQRPDWRETLGYWEGELQKARLSAEAVPSADQLQVAMLGISGALWLPEKHPLAARFPAKNPDSPHVVVSGSSFEMPNMANHVKIGPCDNPGRYSRALPLLLAEHIALRSSARATTLIPWIFNGHGGFAVSGRSNEDEDIVEYVRRATERAAHSADYALNCHLIVRGENYTIRIRLLRCIDGRCLAEITRDFPESAFHQIAEPLFAELRKALAREAEIVLTSAKPTLSGVELDHYLFRLEQALAVGCSTMEEKNAEFLSNPAEILDGMLHLCLRNPQHLPSRMLLLRSLRKLKKPQAALVASMRPKVEALLAEYPIEAAQKELQDEWNEVLVT